MTGQVIGREHALDVVNAFLDRPAEGLSALVLEGEAGIGKSTVWQAAVAAARDRSFRVLTSRPAETERTLAYVVLSDLFGDLEPELLRALSAPRRRAFESALLLRDEPDSPIDPRALGVAITTLLPRLADERPLVIAVDDEQWLDASSTATLGFALRRSRDTRVLLLLSRRTDGTASAALEDAADQAMITRLRIDSLSVGAVQLLLNRRLGVSLPRPTLLQIHEVSGGNPLYAIELARARAADPARDVAVPVAVPASLERLIRARLEGLDARSRRVLLLVAAHGRMPVDLIRTLGIARGALDPALSANLIETTDGVVRFTHPLLASAIYHGASGEQRREAHRQLAIVLDDPVHRGRHLALGAESSDDDLAATLEAASRTARDRGMPIAAAELGEHALSLTPTGAVDDRHRRAISTARAHLEAGDAARARAIADDVLIRAPTGARRAEALVLESAFEDPASSAATLAQALTEAAGEPALEAAIHAALASEGSLTKGRTWAEPHADASLRLAERVDDDALRANALTIVARLRFDRGDPDAFELAERAYRLAASLADPVPVKTAATSFGLMLVFAGDYKRARDWLERHISDWADRDEFTRSGLLWCLALVEVWSGRWSLASEYASEVREISLQYGEAPTDHLSPALIALHRGQIEVARKHSRRALSLASGHLLPQHVAILAICNLWSGSPASALPIFAEAERTADIRGWDDPNERWWRAEYVEALLQAGRVDDAAALVGAWESAAARLGRERVLALARRSRGLIAAARGDLPAALDLLEQAVGLHAMAEDPFGRGRAMLSLGVVRLRAKQKRSAREALESALAEFEVLGAAGWTAVARAELARIGGRERIEGLSPSEARVADLVAAGRTNREIASALFLGERTVASHLTHVYAKLGIRSRTELARHLLPRPIEPASDATKVPTS